MSAMTRIAKIMAVAALAGGLAAPAAAQVYVQPYPPYPQGTYPGQPYGTYPGQPYGGYGGQYGYGNQGVIGNIIDGLIGNRYNVSDRQAVRQCAYAAVQRAESQYRPYFGGQPYAYQGYNGYVRVTAITDVSRRSNGRVRVRGLLDTARGGYGRGGSDLSFRCDVDYRGVVYNVDLDRNNYRRY
jgi:opacity protein-like surface antigen